MKFPIPEDRNTYDTLFALHSFGAFWLENERLIQEASQAAEASYGPKWTPQTQDDFLEFQEEAQSARELYDEIMVPMFRYSSVVTLYSIVERELRRLAENLEEEHGPQALKYKDLKGSLIEQITKFCEVFVRLRLPECPEYGALCDLQKVRDCIVHCHGEIEASRDADRLIRLQDSRPGFHAGKFSSIRIQPACVEQFVREAWRFFIWVFRQLKWKMDVSWQGSR